MQHEFENSFASGELNPEEVKTAVKVLSQLRSMLERVN